MNIITGSKAPQCMLVRQARPSHLCKGQGNVEYPSCADGMLWLLNIT